MLSIVSFIVLLVITVARSAPVQNETCKVQVYRGGGDCEPIIFLPHNCSSATVDLNHIDFLQSCTSVHLHWAYAANNLTLVIGTEEQHAFTVSLYNDQLVDVVSHIYRIIDDKEIEVTTKDHMIVQKSDSHYQVKLKFDVSPELMPYVVFVNYDISKQ